jgi:hypothetical protein
MLNKENLLRHFSLKPSGSELVASFLIELSGARVKDQSCHYRQHFLFVLTI